MNKKVNVKKNQLPILKIKKNYSSNSLIIINKYNR